MSDVMQQTPQQIAALAAQMMRSQGAPMTAENLNRAMLALIRGEQSTEFSMDNAVDRLAERTARRGRSARSLPMPPPATPQEDAAQPVAAPRSEYDDAEMPQFADTPQSAELPPPPPRRTAGQALMAATPELADPSSLPILPLPVPLALMAPRLGVTLQRRALQQMMRGGDDRLPPPAAGAPVPRINGPSGSGSGGAQVALPAPTAQTAAQPTSSAQPTAQPTAQTLTPRRQVSETARQHRQEVRENTARARIEAREARRIAAEQRRQRARGNPSTRAVRPVEE